MGGVATIYKIHPLVWVQFVTNSGPEMGLGPGRPVLHALNWLHTLGSMDVVFLRNG